MPVLAFTARCTTYYCEYLTSFRVVKVTSAMQLVKYCSIRPFMLCCYSCFKPYCKLEWGKNGISASASFSCSHEQFSVIYFMD